MKKLSAIILSIALVFAVNIIPVGVKAASTDIKIGVVVTESSKLMVRESAQVGSKVLHALNKGDYITLISKSGNWWKVEYLKGKYGYSSADYIKEITTNTAVVATESGSLNIRAGAGTTYKSIGVAPKNSTVAVISEANGWSKIVFNGSNVGFVSSRYLKYGNTATDDSIKLNVPSYKQNDKRWADTVIGNSGKTIAEIGCVTTGTAMIESYRIGTAIYPDAMSKKLNYTSSGNVYWPSQFKAVTNSSNYLQVIKEKLAEGKPILFGSKNKNGSQHWVVITGFSGGSLTASNFLINNPGSTERVNLQQHLNSYPTFYKFFYY